MQDIQQPVFGSWYIEEKIGSGSFGTVYRIKREDFGKTYYSALKVIRVPQSEAELRSVRNEFDSDQSLSDYYTHFVQDFAKEIELMAELKGYTNIVSFEDHAFIQDEDGIGWTILIRMELLKPFTEYWSESNAQTEDVVRMGMDICSALEVCEHRHIIHRDIKPDNIFISKNGDFELGDFGIARELEKTTGGLSKKGTYNYMAPEVYFGKPYNNTVDIYSLGIVLYKLLNRNRAPFMPAYPAPITFSDREQALRKRMNGDALPVIPDISAELNAIVMKACAYDPKERYASATEMKAALQQYLNGNEPEQTDSVPAQAEQKPEQETEKTESAVMPSRVTQPPVAVPAAEETDKTVSPFAATNATMQQPAQQNIPQQPVIPNYPQKPAQQSVFPNAPQQPVQQIIPQQPVVPNYPQKSAQQSVFPNAPQQANTYDKTVGPYGAVPPAQPQTPPAGKKKSKAPIIIAVCVSVPIVLVVFLVIIGMLFSSSEPDYSDYTPEYSDTDNGTGETVYDPSDDHTAVLNDSRDGSSYTLALPMAYSELKSLLALHDPYLEADPETYSDPEEDVAAVFGSGFSMTAGDGYVDNISIEVYSESGEEKVKDGKVCAIGIFEDEDNSYYSVFTLNGLQIGMNASEIESTISYDTKDENTNEDGTDSVWYYGDSYHYFVFYDSNGKATQIEYTVDH